MTAGALIGHFQGVKSKSNGGFLARCPSHEDRTQSLSIDVRDGKVLLKCFAGCAVEDIVRAKGLTMADLRTDERPAVQTGRITVESLAASKGLPVAALTRYGVKAVKDLPPTDRLQYGIGGSDGLWIPYFNVDGSIALRTRLRSAHVAKDGSKWLGGMGGILPYGLHDLADAKANGLICLCEGESDYWTLREAGVPALGIPGAQMVRTLQRAHLEGVHAVYVCQDSDPAGMAFVAGLRQHVAAWGLPCYALVMPDGCKDVNDLYRKDVKGFSDRITAMMQKAQGAGAPPAREFSTAGDIYTLTAPEFGLKLELDQIRRSSWGDLTGELAVSSETLGDVFRGAINVSNIEKRQGVARQIKALAGLDVDWAGLMEDFSVRSLKAEREGDPGVWLDEVTPRPADSVISVSGFDIPMDLPSCLFGDGDTGKSYLALYLLSELTARGVRCGIVDAEMEAGIHSERLRALTGQRVKIAHIRVDRPLALCVDRIRRFVRDKQLQFLAYDSVGFLTPEPEKSESALSYMRAVRQIGAGSLSIAHVTKQQDVKPEQQKPFGSNFYYQSFRRIWYAQAEAEADANGRKVIGIWDRKANTATKRGPFALSLTVRDGCAEVSPASMESSPELADKLPLWRQVISELKQRPKTIDELAEATGKTPAVLRATLNRLKDVFAPVDGHGQRKWGLVERA